MTTGTPMHPAHSLGQYMILGSWEIRLTKMRDSLTLQTGKQCIGLKQTKSAYSVDLKEPR